MIQNCLYNFIDIGLCKMGILVIVVMTILNSFWIIICHRANSNSELFPVVYLALFQQMSICILLFFLHPFNVFFWVYSYFVVNLFNKSDFHWHFAHQIKNVKKILMKQNDIWWNLQNFIFWKHKIDHNKIIMSTKNNLIMGGKNFFSFFPDSQCVFIMFLLSSQWVPVRFSIMFPKFPMCSSTCSL